MSESNRAMTTSQSLLAACNEIIGAAQAGNAQGTLAAAQNARNLASQVSNSTQMLNYAITTHFERASFMMSKIQSRINEVASAIQNARMTGLTAGPYTYQNPWQTMAPWQYTGGPSWQIPQSPPLM
ncbi:MAG TPA: hypothetical protein VMW83_01905 [Spirochaetia bacterium]|nr:hypothetical protein [Spirochaetia bacterium]